HDLEIILHLVRSSVQNIDAVGVPVLSRSEDIANARIRFENGCVANVTSSRISPERMRKIRVFQEDAYLSLDYEKQSGEIYRREGGKITRDKVPIEREEALKQQLVSFIECASTGRQPRGSGFQATAALELAVEITKRMIKHYGYFRKQFHETLREIETSKPNAVVLIDYPGFNLRLARALRKRLPAQKIIYYISPQVWAWNRGRIKKMAQWLDLMLCIFPFEA